jgi:regulator of RNase E activity RraA
MSRQTILFSDGYVRVGAESLQRIAEAAEKRAADRAAMEERVERERKVARLINLRNQGKENRK